jgi:predicted Zn-dependent protease
LLVAGVGLLVVALLGTLALAADWLAARVPFEIERRAAAAFEDTWPEAHPVAQPLQALAGRIGEAMELDQAISIEVHYLESDELNAFATLGGHVVVTEGMLATLGSENAQAMVLAHEIGHVAGRHPLRSLGRGAVLGIALLALAGVGADDLAGRLVADAGGLTLLGFSRAQERDADRFALEAMQRLYGHTAGALELYHLLLDGQQGAGASAPAFLSTHPLATSRIADLEALARERGWAGEGVLAPPLGGAALSRMGWRVSPVIGAQ